MKKILCILLITNSLINIYAQDSSFTKPDYDLIKSKTADKNAATYYPKLIKRYNENDTTLTSDEYRLLYYGFLYENGSSPYTIIAYDDSVKSILQQKSLGAGDTVLLIAYEKKILEQSPFSLRNLNILSYAYYKKGDPISTLINFKIRSIAQTVLSTGDGKTVNSGYHVIAISDEYDMLELLGLQFGGSQSLIGNCDYLKVKDNSYDIKGIYFDATKILEAESKLFDH